MRRTATCLLLILVLSSTWAMAETPNLLSYQGKLYDSGGQPVTGSHAIIFSIYTAESGGSLLWRESHPSLAVSDGIYSVVLGQDVALDLDLDQALWLGVTVDSDDEMTPRARLTPAPQALWASGVSWDGVANKPGNVIHVAKTGGDYASIQTALDSITDASATNPYLVLVGPGVFEERVALKPYVHVQGAGQGGTIIQAAGGGDIGASAAVVDASAGGELSRATLRCSSTSEGVGIGLNMSNGCTGEAALRQVDIEVAGSIYAYGVLQYGGILTLEDIKASADASNTSYGMFSSSGSEASWKRCQVTTVSQGLTNGVMVNAPVAVLDDLSISVTSSAASSGIVGLSLIPSGPPSPVIARGIKVAVSAPNNTGETYGLVVGGESRVIDADVEVAGSGLAAAMRLANNEAVVEGASLRVTAGSERVGLLASSFRQASNLNVEIGPESETSGESWAGVKISDDEDGVDFDANHGILSRLNLKVNCSNCQYARGLWADEARGVKVRGADISVSAENSARGVEATTSVDGFELSGAAVAVTGGGYCRGVHFYQSSAEAQSIGMSITDSKVAARDCNANTGIYLENCQTRLGNVDISAQGSGTYYWGLYTNSDISTASTLAQGCRITSSHIGIYDWVPSCSGAGCHQDLLVQGSRIQGDVYAAIGTVGSTIKLGNNQIIGSLHAETYGADFLCSGNYDENMDAVTW